MSKKHPVVSQAEDIVNCGYTVPKSVANVQVPSLQVGLIGVIIKLLRKIDSHADHGDADDYLIEELRKVIALHNETMSALNAFGIIEDLLEDHKIDLDELQGTMVEEIKANDAKRTKYIFKK